MRQKFQEGMMRVVRYFRDLEAWQSAMDLAVTAHSLAGQLPPTHRFELASQMRRSATSIPSNIAEGHSQRGDRVFLRHVRIALGSLADLETLVEIAIRSKLLDQGSVRSLRIEVARTGKLLHGLRRTLRASTALTTLRIVLLFATTGGLAWFGLGT
jgi:four helix bundle protein